MSYALITGATKGIGRAIATELASRMYNVLLVARSENLLKEVADELQSKYSAACHYLPMDLSQPDASEKVLEWVEKNNFPVSVLINNAGYTVWSEFEKSDLNEQLNMMQLNMITLVKLTHKLLPLLRKQKRSYILNVSSTSAYQAIPAMSTYAASKSFVLFFTRALRLELKNSNISVSCISPGTTETDFMNRAKMDALKETAAKFNMKPGVVAKIAVDGMLKSKAEIIPGFINWFSVMMTYLLPKSIPENIAEKIYMGKK
ncbi:MAG TPA: SDR family oxidoreductase [Bacteroidia bacterium]|nr:SDR family oxidoreductase [Bacteroidia bacterium]